LVLFSGDRKGVIKKWKLDQNLKGYKEITSYNPEQNEKDWSKH
jgi:hypothetical protein